MGPQPGGPPLRLRLLDGVDRVGGLPEEESAVAPEPDGRIGEQRLPRRTGLEQAGELAHRRLPVLGGPAEDGCLDFEECVLDDLPGFCHPVQGYRTNLESWLVSPSRRSTSARRTPTAMSWPAPIPKRRW